MTQDHDGVTPIHAVLYDIAKDIVGTVAPIKDRIGAGHLAEGSVIRDVQKTLTLALQHAGFVRVEAIPDAAPGDDA